MGTSSNCLILIAEDDKDYRQLLTQAFIEHRPNCQLRFFADGQQLLSAVALLETEFLPTLILLDLNMPVFDGFTTLKLLKKNPRLLSIPVVMMSNSDYEDDINRCYNLGANAYMVKPMTYQELAGKISRTINYWLQTTELPSS